MQTALSIHAEQAQQEADAKRGALQARVERQITAYRARHARHTRFVNMGRLVSLAAPLLTSLALGASLFAGGGTDVSPQMQAVALVLSSIGTLAYVIFGFDPREKVSLEDSKALLEEEFAKFKRTVDESAAQLEALAAKTSGLTRFVKSRSLPTVLTALSAMLIGWAEHLETALNDPAHAVPMSLGALVVSLIAFGITWARGQAKPKARLWASVEDTVRRLESLATQASAPALPFHEVERLRLEADRVTANIQYLARKEQVVLPLEQ